MNENAVIVLDPVNLGDAKAARERGIKDFIGGNCTVSLMLMAVVRPDARRSGGMDYGHDLSIRLGGRRAKYAGAARANGRTVSSRQRLCCTIRLRAFSRSIAP
jgi:hypothetical protein